MRLLIAMFIIPLLPVMAFADDPLPVDIGRHQACLSENPSFPEECFFHVSSLCEDEEVGRAASQLQARLWCDNREFGLWVQTSNAWLQDLLDGLPDAEAEFLRRQQAHWRSGLDLECQFPARYVSITWVWAASSEARCLLRSVQGRSAVIYAALTHLKAGEFAFQQGGR